MIWEAYTSHNLNHTVVGNLLVSQTPFGSQHVPDARAIYVWLPPSYADSNRRYPVLYMHDGQNLFDATTSYAGEWQVDETMLQLSAEGYEAIIVGLPNAGERRRLEYNPYPEERPLLRGSYGDAYIHYLFEAVKPLIDSDFRTLPDASTTGIAGSSMGGLISLYGFLMYPDVFGFCGCFSPAYWAGNTSLIQTVMEHATGHGRVYLDVGTKEGVILPALPWGIEAADYDAHYIQGVRTLRDGLLQQGYGAGTSLLYVEDEGAGHNEPAWAIRLPAALRFLLTF